MDGGRIVHTKNVPFGFTRLMSHNVDRTGGWGQKETDTLEQRQGKGKRSSTKGS